MTTLDKLLETLRRLDKDRSEPGPEWKSVNEEWQADVHRLMDTLSAWLAPARNQKLVEIERIQVVVSECEGDHYHADALRIIAPNGRFVEVVPKARRVFGALGRVDVVSRQGRALLARLAPNQWRFMWQDPAGGDWKDRPLDEDSFAETLRGMLA